MKFHWILTLTGKPSLFKTNLGHEIWFDFNINYNNLKFLGETFRFISKYSLPFSLFSTSDIWCTHPEESRINENNLEKSK